MVIHDSCKRYHNMIVVLDSKRYSTKNLVSSLNIAAHKNWFSTQNVPMEIAFFGAMSSSRSDVVTQFVRSSVTFFFF